jgi:hypothetical protein
MGDDSFNGITWAVSTTESMLGPYVDVVGRNGSALPAGGEGVINIAVNGSHSFSAWRLRNGSWAGFGNNVPGAKSFSAALIVPAAGDPTVPGGPWKAAGPNLASGSDCSNGFCYAPENPVVTTMSSCSVPHIPLLYSENLQDESKTQLTNQPMNQSAVDSPLTN